MSTTEIPNRQAEIDAIHADIFAERIAKREAAAARVHANGKGTTHARNFSDEELLARARAAKNGDRFAALYDRGDWKGRGYKSQSEADLALFSSLLFWTSADTARAESLFRSSGLMSEKWNREDYQSRTIAKALEGRTEFYTGGSRDSDWEKLRDRIRSGGNGAAPDAPSPSSSEQPSAADASISDEIDCTVIHLPTATRLGWAALKCANEHNPCIFVRDGAVVRVGSGARDQMPAIESVGSEILRYHAAEVVDWIRHTKRNVLQIPPPMSVIDNMLAEPDKPLPILRIISGVPQFDRTGKLHATAGYVPELETYYAPAADLKIPPVSMKPSVDDLTRARNLIREPFRDFRFDSDASLAASVALLFQPVIRPLIRGPVPLFAFDAPVQGTGKSLAAKAALLPTVTIYSSFAYTSDEAEMRKLMTSALAEGRPVLVIDNAAGKIANPVLAKVLTDEYHSDRLLGRNVTITQRVEIIPVITGNNLQFQGDLPRRAVPSRLDTGLEQPWLREPEKFTHPDLLGWVRKNRGALVWAILTVVAGWFAAGAPRSKKNLGSFEEFAAITGGLLEFAEVPGFLDNLNKFYSETDDELGAWVEFTQAWADDAFLKSTPCTTLDLLPLASEAGIELSGKDDRAQSTSLGMQLSKMRGRRFGDWKIKRVVGRHTHWRLLCHDASDPDDTTTEVIA